MTQRLEAHEVAPWATTEVEQFKRRRPLDVFQHGIDVLTHVMIACAFPELLRVLVVVGQGLRCNACQVFGGVLHVDYSGDLL